MEILDNSKDPVVFAEEVLGIKLLEFQKTFLRKIHDARSDGKQIFVCYPYRHGKTTMDRIMNEFYKT